MLLLDARPAAPVACTGCSALPDAPGLVRRADRRGRPRRRAGHLPDHRLTVLPAGAPPGAPGGAPRVGRHAPRARHAARRASIASSSTCRRWRRSPTSHIVAPMADGVLMIVRAGVTPKPAIERALAGLDMSKVLGLVLNDAGADAAATLRLRGLRLHRGLSQSHGVTRVMQLFNRHVSTRSLTVFAGELLLIFGSVALAAALQNTPDLAANLWKIALVTRRLPAVPLLQRLLRPDAGPLQPRAGRPPAAGGRRRVDRPGGAVLHRCPALMIGDGIFVSALFVFLVAILGWRLLFNQLTGSLKLEERILVRRHRRHRAQGRAADPRPARVRLSRHRLHRRRRLAHRRADRQSRRSSGRRPTSRALIAEHQIDRIVVGLSDRRGKLPVEELLRAKMAGIRVEDATTTYERVTGQDPDRRPASELADLLGRLPRLASDALDEARHRPGARRWSSRSSPAR